MKRSFFALMVVTSLSSFPAMAKDIPVDSKIKSAIVYSDRASLTRRAEVKIPAGAHNLIFTNLPISLYADSLRTQGNAKANVTFGALTHRRESSQDFVVPKEKELNAQLVALQDQRKFIQIEKKALKIGRVFLENLGKQAVLRTNEDIATIDLKPESWASAADSISMKMLDNMKSEYTLDIKVRGINEKIRKVQSDLRELRTGHKQIYNVTIPFESDKDTTLTIDLSYQLPNVSWQPIYDARLDIKSGQLELVQYGSVWQRTGEDWTDIDLTLSTAQPSRGASLPNLNPQWISLIKHQKLKRSRSFGGGIAANMTGMVAAPMEEMDMVSESVAPAYSAKKASFKAAKISADGFVGEYNITGPATVKSDGTHAKLLVGSFETENSLQVQIKPQYSTDAYLVVKAKLKGSAPILSGQVNLFRDGAYIGQSYLPMLRPEDAQEIAFGIDDNVRVKRSILKNENSEVGLISKESVVERHFVTEIQNLHKNPIDIAVLETIPSSQDKRLRVEVIKDKTTSGYETDLHDKKGVTRWLQTLQPKQKSKIMLGWKVMWPKDESVSGL